MERSEWPTQERIKELRRRGIVAKSAYACSCSAVLGLIVGLIICEDACKALFSANLIDTSIFSDAHTRNRLLENLTQVLVVPLFLATATYFVCGLLQTKFMFNFSLLWDASRLNPFKSLLPISLFKSLIFALLSGLACLLVSYLIWNQLAAKVLGVLNADASYLAQWGKQFAQGILPATAIFLLLSAVCAYFVARLMFTLQHRMSREEIKREGSE